MNRKTNSNRMCNLVVRIKEEERTLIRQIADSNNMSISEYVRKRTLQGDNNCGLKQGAKVLGAVIDLSNDINDMDESEVKKRMRHNALEIWRLLNDQFEIEQGE